jgi:guanosine-3',5'-bis(diphosphate) 3'-pyrophosphohydrolase
MSSQGQPFIVRRSAQRALDARFAELVEKLRQTRPAGDTDLLRRAYEFAAEQHRTQARQSGEPFLSHPLEVAHLLADMRLDVTTLCAALLHDVVEDTQIPIEQINERFGADVAKIVAGVT